MLYQKFSLFGTWEGHRSREVDTNKEKTRFRIRKLMGIRSIVGFLRGYSFYKVVIRMKDKTSCEYIMENQSCKLSSCRIVDDLGGLVAEVIMIRFIYLKLHEFCCLVYIKLTAMHICCLNWYSIMYVQVKRKTTKSGVVLGEDVLTMVVEPHIDHSLIVALVVVLGLIHHKL